jgi:catechol 2,3-dioxygenase-like lactoylglutathione lyase family enzyme
MKSLLCFAAGVVAGAVLLQTGSAQNNGVEPRPSRALNHIGIVVADYDSAYEFYTGILGLEEAYTVERNGGPLLTYLQLNRETFVELIPARADQAAGVTHFGMEVADIDAFVERLRARGVEVADPGVTPANARFVRIRDADDIEIEVMEFGPEASQYQAMQAWDEGAIRD